MNALRYLPLVLATLCLLLLLGLLHQANGLEVQICNLDDTRLARRVLPHHYKLGVRIPHQSDTFLGELEIHISLNNEPEQDDPMSAKQITLHADKGLHISDVSFEEANKEATDRRIEVQEICRDPENGLVRVELAREPTSRRGLLRFDFTGTIHQEAKGIFNASTDNRRLITTRLMPAYAHEAFPCFDEPDLKATFHVYIELPNELTALSNMQPSGTKFLHGPLEGLKRVNFYRTPKMSTHSVAFAVGEFDRIKGRSGGVEISFWTPPGKSRSVRRALQTATRGYAEMLNYLQIEPILTKIDVITVPNICSAAPYWGMNTIEETFVLAEDSNLTADDSEWVSSAILNNLASHWFGSLVTVKWWDDRWLEVGLAAWTARTVLSKVQPEYDSHMFYLLNTMMKGLYVDSLKSRSCPIKNLQLQTLKQSRQFFHDMMYSKLYCVINMLEDYTGPWNFQKGLRKFISKNLYGNGDADELGAILKEVSGKEVPELMHSWLSQAGHPLVEVSLSGRKLIMKQRKFPSPDDPSALESEDESLWIIPITMLISNDERSEPSSQDFELRLHQDSMNVPPWFDPAKHWLKLNANFEGFYRVHYDTQLFKALGRAVKSKEMPPADRLNLIDDAQTLFMSAIMNEDEFYHVIDWFKEEDDDGVIFGLVEAIRILQQADPNDRTGLGILMRYYEDTGKAQSDPQDSYLKVKVRAEVLEVLVLKARYLSVIDDCYEEYKSLKKTGQPVPGSFRDAIYASVSLLGTDEEVRHLITVEIPDLLSPVQRERASTTILQLLNSSNGKRRLFEYQNDLELFCQSASC